MQYEAIWAEIRRNTAKFAGYWFHALFSGDIFKNCRLLVDFLPWHASFRSTRWFENVPCWDAFAKHQVRALRLCMQLAGAAAPPLQATYNRQKMKKPSEKSARGRFCPSKRTFWESRTRVADSSGAHSGTAAEQTAVLRPYPVLPCLRRALPAPRFQSPASCRARSWPLALGSRPRAPYRDPSRAPPVSRTRRERGGTRT